MYIGIRGNVNFITQYSWRHFIPVPAIKAIDISIHIRRFKTPELLCPSIDICSLIYLQFGPEAGWVSISAVPGRKVYWCAANPAIALGTPRAGAGPGQQLRDGARARALPHGALLLPEPAPQALDC